MELEYKNLELIERVNKLNGLVVNEIINMNILDKLINSSLLQEKVNNPLCKYQNEKKQLKKYKELYINSEGYAKVKLKRNIQYGRCNPEHGLSLFSIRRQIRHTLCNGISDDIDIVCCHHCILYQICKYNNINVEYLEKYVKNRKYYIDLVISNFNVVKDDAKELFIRILYGGNYKKWCKDLKIEEDIEIEKNLLEFIINLSYEFKKIAEIIISNNPNLVDIIKKENTDKEFNILGSVSSYYLQEKEVQILEIIYDYCVLKGYIVNNETVLCADGLILYRKYTNKTTIDRICEEFSIEVKNKTGFELMFVSKEFDEHYLEILNKHVIFSLYEENFASGNYAEYFKMMYGHLFLYNKNILYYYNGIYWIEDDKRKSYLHNFIDLEFYSHLVECSTKVMLNLSNRLIHIKDMTDEENITIEKEKIEILKNKIADFIKQISNLRKCKIRNEFVEDICHKITKNNINFDSDPYLYAFNNKILNLRNNEFIKPCYMQFIKTTCNYNYEDNYSKENINELDKLLDTIFPEEEIKEYYLIILSTGLYGEQIENLFIATGIGGNGKSLINSLMLMMLGEYGYKLPSNVLLQEIKEGGNPQISLMHNKRFILSQEPDNNKKICSSTLKEITGDKTLNTRKLHSNECGISLKLTLVLECNELPQIDEVTEAINRRLRIIPFISRFVSEQSYNILEDKTNIFIGDPYYKTNDFQNKYKQALFEILRKYFIKFRLNNNKLYQEPLQCSNKAIDYLSCSDNIYDWFSTIYNKVDIIVEPIQISIIYEKFKSSILYNNMSKFDKKKYTLKYFDEKIKTNLFLQNYYKPRFSYYNKIRYSTSYIINFKLKDEHYII
jgi:P4 family phage/plasmid primase-like protien